MGFILMSAQANFSGEQRHGIFVGVSISVGKYLGTTTRVDIWRHDVWVSDLVTNALLLNGVCVVSVRGNFYLFEQA